MNNERNFRRAALVLSIIGLVISSYLIWVKVAQTPVLCGGVGDCESVNSSIYSTFHGIPIAVFGALAYLSILVSLLLEPRVAFFASWGPVIEFGLAFAGTLYSAYLTYIELAVLHKICPYCVASAVTITLICIFSAMRLRHAFAENEAE